MTIHGKSRFPGLYIWTRDGQKLPVRVPDGCLLLQVRPVLPHKDAVLLARLSCLLLHLLAQLLRALCLN